MKATAKLWLLAPALLLVGPAAAQDTARGEKLYAQCAQCHGASGDGDPVALAPAIAGFPQWFVEAQLKKFQSGARGTHFDDIAGMRMRPISLWVKSEADVADVSAYVASMPRARPEATLEGGDPARGQAKYIPCVSCHGADGQGDRAQNAPPLVGQSDWYQLSSLKAFKSGVRGGTPTKDPIGSLMRPFSMTLVDEQAMLDVIAYIQSLGNEAGE